MALSSNVLMEGSVLKSRKNVMENMIAEIFRMKRTPVLITIPPASNISSDVPTSRSVSRSLGSVMEQPIVRTRRMNHQLASSSHARVETSDARINDVYHEN